MSADDDIMQATWRALCATGYADLTMQAIADESEKSKASLHYHYDSKQDLLVSFLDHVTDRFLTRLREAEAAAPDTPEARLSAVLDTALSPPETDELEDMQTALLELKTQAPHQPAFRERLVTADEEFRALIEELLAAGVESGAFRADLDPEQTARTIATFFAGGQLRQVAHGESCTTTRDRLDAYLDRSVYRGEQ
ncbi:TetR/AcrR family transcriptional regulator [Salinibaculum rarum]|uniref:TetR/AcrR family transcriptional regulator n=1 Tax=Salinibaculum rarum TaxID=3058903 RepID=UPI00265FD639|nr:TetR/AcrR family transcriptional regulator [Salinibaculum sp. KK48]